MKKEIALVYFAAGISSRFGGKIKQLAKISKRETLIEYSLNQALKSDFCKVIFIVGNKTEKPFKRKFKKFYKGIPVFYALQRYNKKVRDKPWGTVDALCSAIPFLNCSFVVCNGDDIYGRNTFKTLVNHLKNSKEEAVIGYKLVDVLPETGSVNRGIIKAKGKYVKSIKDSFNISKSDLKSKIKSSYKCSMNIFAFHPHLLGFLNSDLKKFKKEHGGDRKIEYRLPHAVSKLIKNKKIKVMIYPAADKWLGITNPGDEKKVREMIALPLGN